ncbi:MAG: YbhN family protein [Calditrichaceae bacterium]
MQYLKTFLKTVISLGLFAYLVYHADPNEIVKVLAGISAGNGIYFLMLAVIFELVSIYLMSLRWKVLLIQYDINIRTDRLFGFYLIGLFFNNFLPTSIGGDVVRIYKAANESENRTAGFASVIIERLVGMASTFFLAIVALFFVSQYFHSNRLLYMSLILFTGIIVFIFLITRNRPFKMLLRIFDKVTFFNIGEKFNKLFEAIHQLRTYRRVFVYVFILSLLSQIAIVLMNYFISQAFSMKIDLLYLFLVVPVTFALTLLPSINGVGVRDGGYVVLLGKIGISGAAAISLSFMNLLIPMFISLFGAILFIIQKRRLRQEEINEIEPSV